jgi:hypothetical protein
MGLRRNRHSIDSTAPGGALHTRRTCLQRRVTSVVFTPDLPERLICSFDWRKNGLFDESYLNALKERDADAQNRLVSFFSGPF